MKFTKGNWKPGTKQNHGTVVRNELVQVSWCGTNGSFGDAGNYKISPDEAYANARLISAAPELYRALDLCLEQMLFSEGGEPLSFRAAIVEAKQALSKARGEL